MDPAKFYHQVEQRVIDVQEHISQLGSIATVAGERHDATKCVLADIANLTRQVADASDYIPPYDQKHYAEAIKRLREMLNEELARLQPKPRFKFKPRTTPTTAGSDPQHDPRLLRGVTGPSPDPAPAATDVLGALPSFGGGKNYNDEIARPSGSSSVRKPSFSTAHAVDMRGHDGLHIILPLTAAKATSSGSLRAMSNCVVDMSEPAVGTASFASLAIRDIDRCLVVAGNVNGPAHITGVRDSVLVVSARQVRIHECRNVRVYLYCTSRPIIEDCEGMKFAPIPACYMFESQDLESSQWDQVDDFKWLKADHSPNWSIIPEGERLPEVVWKEVVKGRPGMGPKDILKEVGVLDT